MSEPIGPSSGAFAPRQNGVFAPISALPSSHGIGDMGPNARAFADLLAEGDQSIWQVLPLAEPGNPANSPYDNHSGFALNRWLVSPDDLVDDGLLSRPQVDAARPAGVAAASEAVDYGAMQRWKGPLVEAAAERLLDRAAEDPDLAARLARFERDNAHWLEDYVRFMHLKQQHAAGPDPTWSRSTWPLRDRSAATAALPDEPTRAMRRIVAEQFLADGQWQRLRDHAAARGVRMMSDLPFYEGDDGVTAWKRPELFDLDDELRATSVGGAPPEPAFPAGQAWGMPSYRGADRAELLEHFATRIEHEVRRVGPGGIVRIDHLLGAAEPYAVDVAGDGSRSGFRALFSGSEWRELLDRFPDVTFVGEDLGELTARRAAFLEELDPSRMRVGLQALLESPDDLRASAHFADNVSPRDVMFTGGTHDYPFLRTYLHDHWDDAPVLQLRELLAERGLAAADAPLEQVARATMQLNAESPAGTTITQVFDLLGMGGGPELPPHARAFNVPGTASSANWATRIPAEVLEPGAARSALLDAMLGLARIATPA